MKTLREISEEVESNKLRHEYEHFYDKTFSHLRDKKDLKILEIGIWRGKSLKMWKEYFPHAQVYGIDINNCKKYEEDRIKTFVCDQNSREELGKVMKEIGQVDIIIDDGSHKMEHMQTSLGFLFPYVKNNGYYAIEDVHTSYFYCNLDKEKLMEMYGISKDFTNTTYLMFKNYLTFGKIHSDYMDQGEMTYLNGWIKECHLDVRNDGGSVCGFFKKSNSFELMKSLSR